MEGVFVSPGINSARQASAAPSLCLFLLSAAAEQCHLPNLRGGGGGAEEDPGEFGRGTQDVFRDLLGDPRGSAVQL